MYGGFGGYPIILGHGGYGQQVVMLGGPQVVMLGGPQVLIIDLAHLSRYKLVNANIAMN